MFKRSPDNSNVQLGLKKTTEMHVRIGRAGEKEGLKGTWTKWKGSLKRQVEKETMRGFVAR